MDIHILNARADAVAFISAGRRSSGKVRDRLILKEYPLQIVEEVIAELIEDGRIDDEAYAASVIKARSGAKAMSASALEYRLIQSGVPKDIAARSVKETITPQNNDASTAYELLDLKFSTKADRILANDKVQLNSFLASIYRFLMSRGFDKEIAAEVVRKFLNDRADAKNQNR